MKPSNYGLEFIPQEEKDLDYYKQNAEEDYMTTPISVLRYITELEKTVKSLNVIKRWD
jgi:hypothetical protein